MLPVIQHAVNVFGRPVDAVMTLQPTSPLRTAEDINKALEVWYSVRSRCLVSVCEGIHPKKSYDAQGRPFFEQVPYDKHRDLVYTRNGAIFITSIDLLNEGRLFDESPHLYLMPKTRSVDVDDLEDLAIAEALLKCGH
jgi:CMP-N-acetylneuraminic acid synthetase